MNAWIQAIIWRYKQGTLTNPVEDCAEELMWVYNCLKGENNMDIHGHTEGLDESFYEIVNYIFLLGTETWGSATVYEYRFTGPGSSAHSPDTVQSVVIGSLETTTGDTPNYKLIVKKVDAQTNVPLAGATFHIAKEGSSLQWNVTTSGTAGTATLDNLSAGTYAITETGAPNGYQIDNPGPEYVTLPANGENTVTKVFTDTSGTHPDGEIRKVDKDDPTKGLAGAVIAIQGVNNTFYGEYSTNASGYLEGVDWEQMGFGAYRAWELRAPEGYSLDSSVKTFRIDTDNPSIQLVFENDAKVKARLRKLDESDNPLPGAVFNIFRDGQLIGTEATDNAGQITVTDVEVGTYTFVEVSAPEGYAKLDQPVSLHVDQADIDGGGIVTVTATDKRLPNLTIEKRDAATGGAIPNTTFTIRGVHSGYQQEVTTGNDGTATLTGIPVDYYEVTETNVPAPYTLSEERTQSV